MTDQTSPPSPPPAAPRPESNRFFAWLRSLGVVRADGWAGGVCGGIALRTGLDPLIVRGIAVVIAILGGPALFFYAAAWLLLPDTHGNIHLERVLRGIFDGPVIAIAVLVVLTFVPFTQGVWWGGQFGHPAWWIVAPAAVLRVLWNLAIVGAMVWFAVWLVRRYRGTPRGARPFGGAGPARPERPRPSTFTEPAADAREPEATASTASTAPPAPADGPDDLAEWCTRYAAWREEHAAWQEQQRAASQSAHALRVAEALARAELRAADAEWRRQSRVDANPRAAGWVIALVLGAALVVGGVAGGAAGTAPDLSRYAGPIGFAAALIVIGLGMVVAGAARRRSGFLAFLAIVTVVLGLGSLAWASHGYLPTYLY